MRSKRQLEKSERMRELNILSGHVSAVMLLNESKSKDCEDILTIIDMAREELKLELFPINDELFGQFKNELLHMFQQKGLEV
jgi:DNA-binding FrmR family transcriptional regulator